MGRIWFKPLLTFAGLVALACIIGLNGYPIIALSGLCAALLLMLGYHLWQMTRLWYWLADPDATPDAAGLWGEIHYRLQRQHKVWQQQLTTVARRYSSFVKAIQASPNGVLILDEHDQIEWCNAMAEAHLALSFERDQHQQITHLIRQPEFVSYLNQNDFSRPLRLSNMGRQHHSVLSLQVFPYDQTRKLMLTQDTTQLESNDAMRRDFVANVSHELKTPLTVLRGFLETLLDLPLNEAERANYLNIMLGQALRMQQIVENLLVLASLEATPSSPVSSPVGLSHLLPQLVLEAEALSAGQHQIVLELETSCDLLGNEAELLSAFSNLLSNAVRYTPEGGKITLHCHADAQELVVAVSDNGIGIEAEHLPRLTERFYRVDRSRSQHTGGTGLGLAIVKHVLSRHQAELKIYSQLGQGSTFAAHFPQERYRHLLEA